MEEQVDRKLNTGRANAPEVVIRATAKVIDPNGFEWLFTLSEGVTGEVYKDFLGVVQYASDNLLANGFVPTGGPVAPQQQQHPAQSASIPYSPQASTPNAPPAMPQASAVQSQSFPASRLIGSLMNGKVYWSIQGGPFTRHGLRVWPEVLEQAGFDANALNPSQAYDLSGYTALYETNAQNHKKVVALQR